MKKLAIITTHPIQYYAPVFKLLHERGEIEIKVFYTWGTAAVQKFDPGFSKAISWDIPLLEGYPHVWVENTAEDKGSHHFKGIVNPYLTQQIASCKPDAILVYGWSYQSHLKILRHYKGRIPLWFRGDSNLIDKQNSWKSLFRKTLLSWVYSNVNKALYVGSANKAYFKKFGMKEEQLIFAPHAVDNHRFAADRSLEVQQLKHKLNIALQDILVLFAGKFEQKKDPLLLLNSLLQIEKEGVHLLFVGNGTLEKTLKEQALPHPNVHFMNFQNQSYMPVVYQACDLFCLPSKGPGETWGLSVNEAMACSKPVLVSDKVGCAIDLVKEGYNGAVFKAPYLASLTEQLHKLIRLGKHELMLQGANSKKIINNWTFQKQAEAIEATVLKHD